MPKRTMPAVSPQNTEEQRILTILENLRKGQPLGSLDSFGVIIPTASEIKRRVKSLVANSRQEGCISKREVIWIKAPRGGGKTETLTALEKELLVEIYRQDMGKSIVVPVDLKQITERTISSGLQAYIFQKATTTSSSPIKTNIDDLTRNLTEKSKSEEVRENIIGLGLDIGFTLINLSAPGASGVATGFLKNLWRNYITLSERNINKLLRARGIVDPDAIILLTKWIKYSISPDPKGWQEFERVFQPLASKEVLFPILCSTLQATGFTTIVLLFDEIDQLIDAPNLTRVFETLWDAPRDNYINQINVFFVLAGTARLDDLKNEEKYAGFSRRFVGARTIPNETYELRRPSPDDCTHAIYKVKDLLQRLTGYNPPEVTPEEETEFMKHLLSQTSEAALTWNDLWAAVCNFYFPR